MVILKNLFLKGTHSRKFCTQNFPIYGRNDFDDMGTNKKRMMRVKIMERIYIIGRAGEKPH